MRSADKKAKEYLLKDLKCKFTLKVISTWTDWSEWSVVWFVVHAHSFATFVCEEYFVTSSTKVSHL